MKRKIPLRKCTGCSEMKSKKELIRVIKDKEGNYNIDLTGKKSGRGAYICPKTECLYKAIETKGLERSFKGRVPTEIYEKLRNELEINE